MTRKLKLEGIADDDLKQLLAPAAANLPSARPAPAPEILPPASEPQTMADFAEAIAHEWETAQERFMRIGALLVKAQASLTEPDYLALAGRLPFGKAVRSQIMTAYKAISSGLVPEVVAAAGHTTVHARATLTSEERIKAADAGLMRADVKQAEVRAFARSVRPTKDKDRDAKLAERDRLLKRLEELNRELGLVDQTEAGRGA